MGESLYSDFIKKILTHKNVSEWLMTCGHGGVLCAFEEWLIENKYLKFENGHYQKYK